MRVSLRARLVALALLPLVAVLPLLVGILVGWGGTYYDRLLNYKIHADLSVANGYFERVKEGVGARVQGLADSESIARLLGQSRGAESLGSLLREKANGAGLDFLLVVGMDGRVKGAGAGPGTGVPYGEWRVTQAALTGHPRTAIDIFSPEQLAAISPTLRERATTMILPTPNAAPSNRTHELRGMVIHAAAPLVEADGRPAGALVGGLMLNGNLAFVDRINEIVYAEGSLPLDSHGTATLFLDDVRIATNVRLFEGGRAIGTRVSKAVRDQVLERGKTWLGRAFVVKDWYVSAYQPIEDSLGRRVGMLYVGFLEAPFQDFKHLALAVVILLFAATIAVASVVSWRWARSIFLPVERMEQTMRRIEEGEEGARVGGVSGEDELAALARHFDQLLDRLEEQTRALKRWGSELDAKVAERTQALEQANLTLRSAQAQLVKSEKLAAIGQLTAGVAHEINNPIAVIQGNVDVLDDVLGPVAQPVRQEIRLIREQIHRIRLIVAKLLQFARPGDYAGYLEAVDVGQLIQDCLVLVGHQMRRGNVAVEQAVAGGLSVNANRNELQQVLINLLVNALQAMPEGGSLRLSARPTDDGPPGVSITVADTGPGLPDAEREQLFAPFFTRKAGGTGLGLWICQSLVERYGGTITAADAPGGGAAFTVWLPREPLGMRGETPAAAGVMQD
ncbi:MAG: cache domain-containing protein [Rhodocyclaceae bacterium]|nr:cache domain-containing protein [Rhodocyclaceae bacterium]